MCQLNLDLRQSDAAKSGDDIPATPVLYITQLLGLALGIPAKDLGLDALSISADSLLSEISSARWERGVTEPGEMRRLVASDAGGAS